MCRILLVEDAVPEPEALRVLIEQHPCAGAIQLESCAFSQVSERISQGPRIDALFAPVDAPGVFPTCASDERAGIALVREKILKGVWGENYFGDVKIVDVNIRRLRMKVEDEPSHPTHIMTVWGYGYRWEE